MTVALTFVIALPLSVWLLATACAAIDEPQPLRPLIRLAAAVSVLLALLLLTERELIYPVMLALAIVTLLHAAGYALVLKKGIGVPIHRPSPPPPPLLQPADEPSSEINSAP